jgi:hypothetical protein
MPNLLHYQAADQKFKEDDDKRKLWETELMEKMKREKDEVYTFS